MHGGAQGEVVTVVLHLVKDRHNRSSGSKDIAITDNEEFRRISKLHGAQVNASICDKESRPP